MISFLQIQIDINMGFVLKKEKNEWLSSFHACLTRVMYFSVHTWHGSESGSPTYGTFAVAAHTNKWSVPVKTYIQTCELQFENSNFVLSELRFPRASIRLAIIIEKCQIAWHNVTDIYDKYYYFFCFISAFSLFRCVIE